MVHLILIHMDIIKIMILILHESVITNDFLFSSNDYINNKGIITNYELLLKNSNSYSNNSTNFEENGIIIYLENLKLIQVFQ